MHDAVLQTAVWVAYQRLSRCVGRHGLRWIQCQEHRLAVGYDPQMRARQRLPRKVVVEGCSVAIAWFSAPQLVQAQAWPKVESAPPGAAGFGTLAAVLRSRESPATLLGLTAGHVLNAGSFGDRVSVRLAHATAPLLTGQLYDWMPEPMPQQSVDVDAALVTLPANALEVLADQIDWPRGANRQARAGAAMALLTRHHRIEGLLSSPLTTMVQAGAQQYTMNNALCYRLADASRPGDSGAPLWDAEEHLIGVHLGAAPAGVMGDGVGTPIGRVLDWAEADLVPRNASAAASGRALPAAVPAAPLPTGGPNDTMARTLWGEARNQGRAGMEAVAHVIFNREADRRWRGRGGLAAICLQPAQFSCWNAGDANRKPCLDVDATDAQFAQAQQVVQAVRASRATVPPGPDPTGGATHYHAVGVMPTWALAGELTVRIGQHLFYRNVP
ncbi:MAG: cell wall hydrolase [Roseateles sp.]|uniref:cell wall hydrolase n=1 Tax=Roseateles sp. TaxID=1971397 RepID=UPI004035D298